MGDDALAKVRAIAAKITASLDTKKRSRFDSDGEC